MNSRNKIIAFLTGAVFLISNAHRLNAQVTSFSIDETKIDRTLARQLDSISLEDQQGRLEWSKLRKAGAAKQRLDSLKNKIKETDKSNLAFIENLLGERGWPGPQEVGFQASQAVFLVIQHAGLATQKKYYPLIRQAEEAGKILSSNVAILEDRIAVREGKEQVYGSQGYYDEQTKRVYIYPVKDVENLDSLRKSRGLSPMSDYVKEWSVDDYKRYLPVARAFWENERRKTAD